MTKLKGESNEEYNLRQREYRIRTGRVQSPGSYPKDRKRRIKVTPEVESIVILLIREGKSQAQIAREIGASDAVVTRIAMKHKLSIVNGYTLNVGESHPQYDRDGNRQEWIRDLRKADGLFCVAPDCPEPGVTLEYGLNLGVMDHYGGPDRDWPIRRSLIRGLVHQNPCNSETIACLDRRYRQGLPLFPEWEQYRIRRPIE